VLLWFWLEIHSLSQFSVLWVLKKNQRNPPKTSRVSGSKWLCSICSKTCKATDQEVPSWKALRVELKLITSGSSVNAQESMLPRENPPVSLPHLVYVQLCIANPGMGQKVLGIWLAGKLHVYICIYVHVCVKYL
jgi:hypothetical protein